MAKRGGTRRKSGTKKEGESETPIERVLLRLEGVQPENGGQSWMACCPAHDDSTPSLHVTVNKNGDVVFHCFGGCHQEAVREALGVSWTDLFAKNGNRRGRVYPPETHATVQPSHKNGEKSRSSGLQRGVQPGATTQPPPEGCTLAQYAEAKQLPIGFLRELGLTDVSLGGRPAIRIPYLDQDGNVTALRFRTALEGDKRFCWRRGSSPCLYGLEYSDVRDSHYVILVEGESDCHTLWGHSIPALGVPGAGNWKEEWAPHLEGFETIYVVVEPDKGGETLMEKLTKSAIRERVKLVDLGEHKDPSGLYLSDPKYFKERFEAALEAAIPWIVTDRQSHSITKGSFMMNFSGPIDVGNEVPSTEPPAIDRLQRVVEEHFPALWLAVDLGLSVAATLLLEKNVNPVALIYVGKPSSGKTTVTTMFAGHKVTYVSDKFTPAAFVSHAANVSREQLKEIDLLPKIRHKLLITPEMAPTFRGKEDDLTERINTLIRVLDGQGLRIDSGTQGDRGYEGDYLFAWLGGTTPLDDKVWAVMAQLGSRLFFFVLGDGEEVTEEDLIADSEQKPYMDRLAECKHLVHEVLTVLFGPEPKERVRSVPFQVHDLEIRRWLDKFALVLARARASRGLSDEGEGENPHRIYAVLNNLAHGHTIVHGRERVTMADLSVIAEVTISSMPTAFSRLFRATVHANELTITEAQAVLGKVHHVTAEARMKEAAKTGIFEFVEGKGASRYSYASQRLGSGVTRQNLRKFLVVFKIWGICLRTSFLNLA